MALEEMVRGVVEFVREHQVWAAPIVGALAFGESLAFISLLIPAWSALIGIGAMVGASDIKFWPVWVAGALGAALGDWLSYWLGYTFKDRVARMWPLSRYPEMLPRAEKFVSKCALQCRWSPVYSRCRTGTSRSRISRRPSSGRRLCCCSATRSQSWRPGSGRWSDSRLALRRSLCCLTLRQRGFICGPMIEPANKTLRRRRCAI